MRDFEDNLEAEEIPVFSYFSAVFSTFILFFSQKLKEASEIR